MLFLKKGFTNLFFAIIAKLLSGLKLILIGILIARSLGPEQYGILNYVISFVTILSVLAEFRLHNILIREFSEAKGNVHQENKLFGSSFFITSGFAFIGFLTLLLIVYFKKESFEVKTYIIIYGLSYFFQSLRFLKAFFVANHKNEILGLAEGINAVLLIIFCVIFILLDKSLIWYVGLLVFDFVIISSVLLFFLKRTRKASFKEWKIRKQVVQKILKDSYPLVLSGFAIIVFQKVDQIMIKEFIDEKAVGYYAAAVSLTSLIAFIPVVVTETLVPKLIQFKESENKNYQLYSQVFSDLLTQGTIIISLTVMILSSFLINLLYGSEFSAAIEIVKLFVWKGVFVAMGAVAAQLMIIENIHHIAYIKSVIGAVLNIILNYILIPEIGIMGAVWASLISFLISSYVAHIFFKRYKYIFFIQTRSLLLGKIGLIKNYKLILKFLQL